LTPRLTIKRYQGDHQPHAHAFAQLVLPIQGGMELELAGRSGTRLHTGLAALVAPDCGHAQQSEPGSRFLVIDCAADWLPAPHSGSRATAAGAGDSACDAAADRLRRADFA